MSHGPNRGNFPTQMARTESVAGQEPVFADSGRRIRMIFNLNRRPCFLIRRHDQCVSLVIGEADKDGWREGVSQRLFL